MLICMYIWIYCVHTCMFICYVLVFLQMRCLCVCNCLGRDRIGSVNWIKLKNFPCQNMFVCLFMYVCTRIGLCACVHAGPQSVGGQQQQKSRHYFNEYRDHFRLCLKFLFFELIVCFFNSVDYSMLHYINPYNNCIFITVFMITYVHIYICNIMCQKSHVSTKYAQTFATSALLTHTLFSTCKESGIAQHKSNNILSMLCLPSLLFTRQHPSECERRCCSLC